MCPYTYSALRRYLTQLFYWEPRGARLSIKKLSPMYLKSAVSMKVANNNSSQEYALISAIKNLLDFKFHAQIKEASNKD